MFVYHTGTGLDGEGLYVWQYDSDASSGTWLKFAAGEIGEVADGTTPMQHCVGTVPNGLKTPISQQMDLEILQWVEHSALLAQPPLLGL